MIPISSHQIVAVDDKKEHLEKIVLALAFKQIPCTPIHFNSDSPEGLPVGPEGFPDVRVILMDLNFQSQGTAHRAEQMDGTIASHLKKIDPKGPCILILWSGLDTELAAKVLELINDKSRHPDLPIFLYSTFLRKPADIDTAIANLDEIGEALKGILEENPLYHAIVLWEYTVSKAATETTGSLISLAKKNTGVGDDPQEKLLDMFESLALCVAEGNNEYPISSTVELGLLPVFSDHLANSLGLKDVRESAWNKCFPAGIAGKAKTPTASALNSWIHLEQGKFETTTRGGVSILSEEQINELFGLTLENIFRDILFNQDKIKGKSQQDIFKIINKNKFGLAEISAKCDYAQKRLRLFRYIPIIIAPVEGLEFFSHGNGKTKNDSIYKLQELFLLKEYEDKPYAFFFLLNYLICLTQDQISRSFPKETAFRLRENITDHIAQQLANHATRLGIASIR